MTLFWLAVLTAGVLVAIGLGFHAVLVEPRAVRVTHYRPQLPNWPADFPLRIVVISDIHACEPWTGAEHIAALCARANALTPDIVLLLGDYRTGPRWSREVEPAVWAGLLASLDAPLGVHAILGNHDYIADGEGADTTTQAELALKAVGIAVYVNLAVRIAHRGRGFWLAGLGDQMAFYKRNARGKTVVYGLDDLDATMAQVLDDEPVLLMAHEPDIFAKVPARVALTLSGHTHSGQVRLFGYAPIVPSRFGNRYVHGHIVEGDRHLIVSAGLGMSGLPIRFGARPEMVLIELGGGADAQ